MSPPPPASGTGPGRDGRLTTWQRILVAAASAVLLAVCAGGFVGYAVWRAPDRAGADATAGPLPPDRLLVRTDDGAIAAVVPNRQTNNAVTDTGLRCQRFAIGGGTAVCLRHHPSTAPMTEVAVYDTRLRPVTSFRLPGVASRARVSPSGRMIAWTTFVAADSYAAAGFSTRTGIYDTVTGEKVKTMEDIALSIDGKVHRAADVNYWGVTWADDDTFYATVATGETTYLVRGSWGAWTAEALRENVECPSLSPDGTRIAFKKRVPGADADRRWRLAVLDLATMAETELPGTDGVDDQALWLPGDRLAYAEPSVLPGVSDLWSVPADGSAPPRLLRLDSSSPALS